MYTSLLGIQIQTGLKDSVYIELQSIWNTVQWTHQQHKELGYQGFTLNPKGRVLALDIDWDQVDC